MSLTGDFGGLDRLVSGVGDLANPTFRRKVLESAIANAENNHNADIDALKVDLIYIDEAPSLKRFHARAKGRGNRIVKRNSHITILVGDGRKD